MPRIVPPSVKRIPGLKNQESETQIYWSKSEELLYKTPEIKQKSLEASKIMVIFKN